MVSTSLILNLRTEKLKRQARVREKARAQTVTCHQEINPLRTQVIKGSMVDRKDHQRKIIMVKSKMVSTWMVSMNSDNHKKEVVPVAVVVEEDLAAVAVAVAAVAVAVAVAAAAVAAAAVAVAAVEDQEVAAKMVKKWTQLEEAMANPPRASMMLLKAATKLSELKDKAKIRRV